MDAEEFRFEATRILQSAPYFVLVSDKPVGLIVGLVKESIMEPHVDWFPWATPRQKLETIVRFINEMRMMYVLLVTAREEDWGFFDHIKRYGILRIVGRINGYYGRGDAMLYQSRWQ